MKTISNWKDNLVHNSKWVIIDCATNRVVAWFDNHDDLSAFYAMLEKKYPYNTYKIATL